MPVDCSDSAANAPQPSNSDLTRPLLRESITTTQSHLDPKWLFSCPQPVRAISVWQGFHLGPGHRTHGSIAKHAPHDDSTRPATSVQRLVHPLSVSPNRPPYCGTQPLFAPNRGTSLPSNPRPRLRAAAFDAVQWDGPREFPLEHTRNPSVKQFSLSIDCCMAYETAT